MNNAVHIFLKDHKLQACQTSMSDLVQVFTGDMELGLQGKAGALRMIPTYIEAENNFLKETPVLAIDAGGTNFRAAIVTVRNSGQTIISDMVTHRMPGLDGEISSHDFFGTLASWLRPLDGKINRLGFCFSYPTEILPDRDGKLIQFCKELKAPEVHGKLIGKTLLKYLGSQDKHIVLLNDTVATLLAGKSFTMNKVYDSYIGFILGTGTNTCYIEKNINIIKSMNLDPLKSQIINIESGDFGRPPVTSTDILFDETTVNPGSYKFEKMISGGYFGGLTLFVLKQAVSEGVFSGKAGDMILKIEELTSAEANEYISGEITAENVLDEAITNEEDAMICKIIIEALIDRAAKLAASSMAAVVLKTGKGLYEEKPVLITVEGTTFHKLFNFRKRFENYFNRYLSGDSERYAEFTSTDHSSLAGAALAALIV